jgi:hypothetical protein
MTELLDRLRAALAGRYILEGEAGAGGMAIVYRAHDVRHNRTVAMEAAGQRDSALYAYGKFVRLWDKADPSLQGRVKEAREAMARLSAEPKSN